MDILNKLNPKPAWVKQGAYLVAAFNMAIDTHTNDTVSVVIFDHYSFKSCAVDEVLKFLSF